MQQCEMPNDVYQIPNDVDEAKGMPNLEVEAKGINKDIKDD